MQYSNAIESIWTTFFVMKNPVIAVLEKADLPINLNSDLSEKLISLRNIEFRKALFLISITLSGTEMLSNAVESKAFLSITFKLDLLANSTFFNFLQQQKE